MRAPLATTTKSMGGHQRPRRGASDEWLTPASIVESIGPPFDLDPCGHPCQDPRLARVVIQLPRNGLLEEWAGEIWLNPPYGPETDKWMERMALHNNGVALVFARTDTRWWHRHVAARAMAVFFIRGRVRFARPDGEVAADNGGAPSALVGYGKSSERLLGVSRRTPGWLVRNQ